MLHNGKFCKLPMSDATLEGNHINYGSHMDQLMIPLCDSFNTISGLQTISSCEGHFKKDDPNYQPNTFIMFMVDDIKALNFLRRIVNDIRSYAAGIWLPGSTSSPYWKIVFTPVCTTYNGVEYEGYDKITCAIERKLGSVREREYLFKLTQAILDEIPKAG